MRNIFVTINEIIEKTISKLTEISGLTPDPLFYKDFLSGINNIRDRNFENGAQYFEYFRKLPETINKISQPSIDESPASDMKYAIKSINSELQEEINNIINKNNISTEILNDQFIDYLSFSKNNINYLKQTTSRIDKDYKELRNIINKQFIEIEKLKEINSKTIDEITNTKNSAESSFKHFEKEIHQKLKSIDKLISTATNSYLASNYVKAADDEKSTADTYRKYTIWMILIISMISVYTLGKEIFHPSKDLDFYSITIRFTTILCLSIGAAYFSRESNKHRQHQYYLHDKSLALSTVDSYISSASKDIQDIIKKDLSNAFFSGYIHNNNQKESYPIDNQLILEKLIDKIPASKNTN